MQLPTLSEKSLVYNITLRWFLLQHVHWNRSFHVWISPFVIKFFPGSMVQVSGSADLDNLKLTLTLPSTSYVTLESNSLFGSWFSTWEMKNLNWVTTKFPSRFKILLFIWVNICLAETCSTCSLTQPALHILAFWVFCSCWTRPVSLIMSDMMRFLDLSPFWLFSCGHEFSSVALQVWLPELDLG